MSNGGMIGQRNVPGVDGISGVWSMREIADAKRAGKWEFLPVMGGLLRWYNADSIELLNTDPVPSWPDGSPASDPAVQATAANQPVLRTNILNGHAVVRFDGSNDFLEFGEILDSSSSTGHIFLVAKQNATDIRAIIGTRPASATQGWMLRYQSATQLLYFHTGSSPNISYNITDKFNVIETQRNGLEVTLGTDGTLGTPTTISGYAPSALGSTVIGAGLNALDGQMSGDIAEIVIYDHILSGADRTAIVNYLLAKYAL